MNLIYLFNQEHDSSPLRYRFEHYLKNEIALNKGLITNYDGVKCALQIFCSKYSFRATASIAVTLHLFQRGLLTVQHRLKAVDAHIDIR